MDSELRDLYQEVVLDHGRKPRNFRRRPEGANRDAEGYNPLCGDRVCVHLAVDADGRIRDAGFEGAGCAISMASTSLMTEILKGKSAEEAEALAQAFYRLVKGEAADVSVANEDDIDRLHVLAGVAEFPMRVKCATLAWHTMQAALERGPADKAKPVMMTEDAR
jgi:nitrogen fixation NifU-like protein